MAKHNIRRTTKSRRRRKVSRSKTETRKTRIKIKRKRSLKRPPRKISEKRFQRGLRILQELKDLFPAAKAAGVSPKEFTKVALAKGAIRKQGKGWVVKGSLPRQMLIFSGGREVTVTVRGLKAASLIGSYMAAVKQFLKTNNASAVAPFIGRGVKDTARITHPFETNPNSIYRLASAGDQAFEQIYRIVV